MSAAARPNWDASLKRIWFSGDPALIKAAQCGQLSVHAANLLALLDTHTGTVTADVAEQLEPSVGLSKRQHTTTVRVRLVELERKGWARKVTGAVPVSWVRIKREEKSMQKFYFTAPLDGMWDEMQPNLIDHNISAVRNGEVATFTGAFDDLDCFVSKHYDGSGHLIELKHATAAA